MYVCMYVLGYVRQAIAHAQALHAHPRGNKLLQYCNYSISMEEVPYSAVKNLFPPVYILKLTAPRHTIK